jgi:hypothetical protein
MVKLYWQLLIEWVDYWWFVGEVEMVMSKQPGTPGLNYIKHG